MKNINVTINVYQDLIITSKKPSFMEESPWYLKKFNQSCTIRIWMNEMSTSHRLSVKDFP